MIELEAVLQEVRDLAARLKPNSFEAWDEQYGKLVEAAERYEAMVNERCRELAREAGIDPTMWGLHAHNAHIAQDRGRPWPGVDYARVDLILALEKRHYAARRIIDEWCVEVRNYAIAQALGGAS